MADEPKGKTNPVENPAEPQSENNQPPEPPVDALAVKKTGLKDRLKRWQKAYLARKKLTFPATIIAVLLIVLAIPFTRYPVLGLAIKRSVDVTVTDKVTNKPVSGVELNIAGKLTETNSDGKATVKQVAVGRHNLTVTKKYYKDNTTTVMVPIRGQAVSNIQIEATGRQVPISVTNKITGKGIKDAEIQVLDTTTKTDANGKATVVLPTTSNTEQGVVKLAGYNDTKVAITVTDQDVTDNHFSLTPAGKIYFLSKLSGKIDVVKTNLDGTNRQTVLAGTGNEDDSGTVLLASRDWRYLALLSRRDGTKENQTKLYLIETASDKLTTMDEGDATFSVQGWSGHRFIYTVYRLKVPDWKPKQSSLKSYNAESKQITALDDTYAEGYTDYDRGSEQYGSVYILDNLVVFTKNWTAYTGFYKNHPAQIISVRPDGSNKQVLKKLSQPANSVPLFLFFESRPYKAQEIYFRSDPNGAFFEYQDGQIKDTHDINDTTFYNTYPTYLVSPAGNQTFWSESRDGKNRFFIGNLDGDKGKQIASLNDYSPYGWYTDNYLLVSKNGSELNIMSVSGGPILKVSDYHKPDNSLNGYGYGYGGF